MAWCFIGERRGAVALFGDVKAYGGLYHGGGGIPEEPEGSKQRGSS